MGPLGYPLCLCVNLLFRKFVGCGGPKLTGGASGQGVLRGTFGPGPLVKGKGKKKGNMGITILPPWRFCFLILFSFCLLTVQLHFTPILNFKQSTHAQKKKSVFILFLSTIYLIIYTVKEEIFVGEKFRTFRSKTFRMELNFVLSN